MLVSRMVVQKKMYLEYKLLTTFDSPLTSLDLLAKNILNTLKLNSGPHLCRYETACENNIARKKLQ
jgi:hypothetical protein